MTFIEKFEQIKKKIGTPDTSRLSENFAVQVNLIDEDCGGAFYVSYQDGVVAIEPYDYHDHTAMVNVKAQDLLDAISGKLDAVGAVMTGKIEVFGNVEHLKAVLALKKPAAKRAPKKATEKKEPAKKAAKKAPAAKEEAKAEVKAEPKAEPKVEAKVETKAAPAEKKASAKKTTKK